MRLLSLLLLVACPGPSTDPTDPTGTTPTDPPVTLPPGTDQGNLALIRGYENGVLIRSELVGLFANDLQEVLNPAHCVARPDRPCLHSLPDPGLSLTYDLLDRYVENQSFYRYVGLSVPFGPFEAYYSVESSLSWYYADLIDRGDIQGPVDVTVGVEWGDTVLTDVVDVPPSLDVFEPRQGETIRAFSSDEDFTFSWTPQNAEEMYLFIQTDDETDPGRIYRIADNGSYTLDLSSLDLFESTLLYVQLARWSRDEADVNGNTLTLHTTAEADFVVEYVPVGQREPIEVANDCFTAPVLPVGGFYGDLDGLGNTFEVSDCMQSGEPSAGRDAVFTLEIPPYHRAELDYRQLQANAAFYILEDCNPDLPVCIEGADRGFGLQTEVMTRFNSSDSPEQFTLVLDGVNPGAGGLFFVDYRAVEFPDPSLQDICIDALDAPELQPGEYYAPVPGRLGPDVNPGFQGCTGTSLPGPDGTRRVVVPSGTTLEATISMPEGNPALYLSTSCEDLDTCVAGSDSGGSIETVSYTNATTAPQTLLLTIDTGGVELLPFFLTVTIQ